MKYSLSLVVLMWAACSRKPEPTFPLSEIEKKKPRALELMKQVGDLLDSKTPDFGGLGADVLGLTAQATDGADAYSTLSKDRGDSASVLWDNEPAVALEGDGLLTGGRFFAGFRDEVGRPCFVVRFTVRRRDQTFHVMIALAP